MLVPATRRLRLRKCNILTNYSDMEQFERNIFQSEKNWAGNITYSTTNIHRPSSVEEIRELIRSNSSLRTLGSRHSFNRIADSSHALVSTENLQGIIALDKVQHQVCIQSGCRYGDIALFLHENGYALHNLASLPHITVAGAVATATHGSGVKNQSLASAVAALEFMDGSGDLVSVSRQENPGTFEGMVVNLGALGIVTALTLDLLPAFEMKQTVYLDLPFSSLKKDFLNIVSSAYSISLFTDWISDSVGEVWVKQRSDEAGSELIMDAIPATEDVHPIHGESAVNVTTQRGIAGPWYERMPHFKMGFKPSAGAELQSEFFIPLEMAVDAMSALQELSAMIKPVLLISEIRTIAADNFWMSPFYQQAAVAFHFTWKQEVGSVMQVLPKIEAALMPFGVRAHWGKLFTLSPDYIATRYEKLEDFKWLVQRYDPEAKFRNDYISNYLFNGQR
jgi:xylitol oxidase